MAIVLMAIALIVGVLGAMAKLELDEYPQAFGYSLLAFGALAWFLLRA